MGRNRMCRRRELRTVTRDDTYLFVYLGALVVCACLAAGWQWGEYLVNAQ